MFLYEFSLLYSATSATDGESTAFCFNLIAAKPEVVLFPLRPKSRLILWIIRTVFSYQLTYFFNCVLYIFMLCLSVLVNVV